MRCPKCGERVETIDSRTDEHNRTRRKKACYKCGYTFQTVELTVIELAAIEKANKQ